MRTAANTSKRWTRFEDEALQARLIEKATQLAVDFTIDADGRIWFDDDAWCRVGDPPILVLDEAFGLDWVAVYADDAKQRAERITALNERGIRYVIWSDDPQGTSIVMDQKDCPATWEYA